MKPISHQRKLITVITSIAILVILTLTVFIDQWLLIDLPRFICCIGNHPTCLIPIYR